MASVFHERCKACGTVKQCRTACSKCNGRRIEQAERGRLRAERADALMPREHRVVVQGCTISDLPNARQARHTELWAREKWELPSPAEDQAKAYVRELHGQFLEPDPRANVEPRRFYPDLKITKLRWASDDQFDALLFRTHKVRTPVEQSVNWRDVYDKFLLDLESARHDDLLER